MLNVRWWSLNIQEFIIHIFFQQANKQDVLKNVNVIKINNLNRVNSFFGMGGLDGGF